MSRIKNVMVLSPQHWDATSWYRASGPFSALKNDKYKIQLSRGDVDWTHIAENDVLFMHRPYNDVHLQMAEVAKSLNKRLWIDFDDLLTDVPFSNPAFFSYQDPRIRANLKKIMNLADIITVSTEDLRVELIQYAEHMRVFVVPNAWNDYLHPWQQKKFIPHKMIFWRGSATHNEDVQTYLEGIESAAKKLPDWKWLFLGHAPYKVREIIDKENLIVMTSMELIKYFNFMRVCEASVCIVPLANNAFNRSKSNIAWQEATLAGMATVAPMFDEWNQKGMIHYEVGSNESFANAVLEAAQNAETLYNESWKSLNLNRRLSTVNKTRLEILERLCSTINE